MADEPKLIGVNETGENKPTVYDDLMHEVEEGKVRRVIVDLERGLDFNNTAALASLIGDLSERGVQLVFISDNDNGVRINNVRSTQILHDMGLSPENFTMIVTADVMCVNRKADGKVMPFWESISPISYPQYYDFVLGRFPSIGAGQTVVLTQSASASNVSRKKGMRAIDLRAEA